MRDLRAFRAAVWQHRRAVGRTQQQLARSIGLHPDVLSHKINGSDNAVLTMSDAIGIATTLVSWGAVTTRADLKALLDLVEVPPQAIPAARWSVPPLAALRDAEDGAARRPVRSAAAPAPASGRPAPLTAPLNQPSEPSEPSEPPEPSGPLEPEERWPRLTPSPLPAPATALIGRERERAVVAAAVAASRLVTLTGVGGTGKTRLALQAARDLASDFADGVAFIDLAPVRDARLIAPTLARAVGLAPASPETAEAYLTDALRDRELLLVVDNVEHLLDETQVLARLLAADPAIRLLATSRIALRLYGERTVRVPPLHVAAAGGNGAEKSEAVQLFLARARAARPNLAPDSGELAAIAEICAALDGLPLAIELAAARTRLYPPRDLLPLLRSRIALLTGGPRDAPYRQQTLRATLDWSHELLSPSARRLFTHLGVFAGPFDAAAAAAVSGTEEPLMTLEILADLADQSLLEVVAGATPSFRMLQIVREYAYERLAETGELDLVQRRHLAYFLALALAARPGLNGPRQAELLDELEQAYPNLRAALDFAYRQAGPDGPDNRPDHQSLADGLRLAAALRPLWQQRGSLAEGVLQLDRLLAADDVQRRPSDAAIRAAAVLAACALACFRGNYPRTTELARHGIELCSARGDHHGLAVAHRFLGEATVAVGADDEAEHHFEHQLAEAAQAGNLLGQAEAYNMLGEVARHRGDFRRARLLLWSALKVMRQAGDPGGVGVILSSLGEVARDAGQPRRAWRLFGAALRRHAALGDKRHMAYELEGLASAAGLEQEGRQALLYLGAAQVLREETGGPLPPFEQAIVDRILAPAVAPLSARDRQDALDQGRNQPLSATITQALTAVGR
jgi:non-specific serine/threonine protein kinase